MRLEGKRMSKHLDDLLADSRPGGLSSHPAIKHQLSELVAEAEPSSTRRVPFWKRKRFLLPAAAFLILATTAGAVVAMWVQDSDVAIPISYITDTGKTIECTFAISANSVYRDDGSLADNAANAAEVSALREFMQTNDWSDLGQQAYERATDDARVPPGDGVDAPFNLAVSELIDEQLPKHLFGDGIGWGWGAGSDCSGQLH